MTATQSAPGERFPKSVRVRRRGEYLAIQSRGRRVSTAHFVFLFRDRGDSGPARLGVTASRKAGGSVQRNRVRRLLRESFRKHLRDLPPGYDIVALVKAEVPPLALRVVCDEMLDAVRRARKPSGVRS